jgi:hypothetical protein
MTRESSRRQSRPSGHRRGLRPALFLCSLIVCASAATFYWRAVKLQPHSIQAGPPGSRPVTRPTGQPVGMLAPEEAQTHLVATKQADGRIVLRHAAGRKAADALVHEDSSKARNAPPRETVK